MNLTEQDVAVLRRNPGDLLRLIKQARTNAAQENTRRRALVLRHPDLAERLTQPPIGHTTPQHWTGYVPPEYDAPSVGGSQPINNSPIRAALAALVAEAEARDTAGHNFPQQRTTAAQITEEANA
ncbi:hypothetical protein [Streptomyces sp. XY006]|uniref:hypothetical protein n=1 Tax=Streptomyces sp. XY006 TaxID=2021410 RepID=UPI000B8BE216|nr:hypothetical protein [Streptomyces sp. XY006]OXS35417.1 hypothetical protein CHR28_10440 [Streptomyces sp. XY006]